MENVIINGFISTTSNKQNKEFKVETPQKTAYLVLNTVNKKLLEDFGLTPYTSKEGEDFFCVKVVNQLKLYLNNSNVVLDYDATVNDPNFKTEVPVRMNIIKGEKNKNVFYRLQALQVDEITDLVTIEATNPFL